MIKFRMPLLAVRDVEISKKFYHDLFDQEVVLDLGGNVTFSGGFAVQQDFDRLTGVPKSTILHQSHNMELYFEVDDFDAFTEKLRRHLDVELGRTGASADDACVAAACGAPVRPGLAHDRGR